MGKFYFNRRGVDGSVRLISNVNFKVYRFTTLYQWLRVKRVLKGNFYIVKFFIYILLLPPQHIFINRHLLYLWVPLLVVFLR